MPVELAPYAEPEVADKEYLWTLNFGPQHPATHTTLRLILTLDGERVVKAIPDIGYLHSGFEKLGEDLDFNQYVTIVDRMNYISPIANEVAWHHTVRLLNRNRIFVDRTKGIGVLSKEDAINTSCSGPVARASGVVRDLRKDLPYLAYKDFDFKVVCAAAGDCYARYLVRMQEMLEALKIIHQAVENLPSGAVNVDVEGKAVMPDKSAAYRSIEGLIQHFELIMTNRQWDAPVN